MVLVLYIFKYLLLIISVVGYGALFQKFFFNYNNKLNTSFSLGYLGIFGIFFLILISYLTNLFYAHDETHNLIIFIFGITSFIFFFYKNYKSICKTDLLLFIIFFLISIFGLLLFKNHDDFLYYHFNFILNLTLSKTEFGLGNFDPAFNHVSSLFFFNSLIKMKFTGNNFYNVVTVFIIVCVNTILVKNIISSIANKKINYILFLSLFIFLFINIFFYRISEHGTDRSAQILILLLTIILFEILESEKIPFLKIEIFLVILTLVITIKAFYLIYGLFFLLMFNRFYSFSFVDLSRFLKDFKIIYISFISIFFVAIYNVIYTGCLIFPLKFTCFDSFFWGQGKERIASLLEWYQIWSKGGAAPNFRVDNPTEYISGFNWVSNWIEIYFFNKVSDTLLGLIVLSIIVIILFMPIRLLFKYNRNLILFYFLLLILFLEWFYLHPALRYGGYHIIALIFFIPISILLGSQNFSLKKLVFKINCLICLGLIIFVLRNVNRLYSESNKYNFSVLNPIYQVNESLKERKNKVFIDTKNCTTELPFTKKQRINSGSPNCKIIANYIFFY